MSIDDNCFVVTDETSDQQGQQQQAQEREYCSDGQRELKAFVKGNELEPPILDDDRLNDDNRILLIYGNQTAKQLGQELSTLQELPILNN